MADAPPPPDATMAAILARMNAQDELIAQLTAQVGALTVAAPAPPAAPAPLAPPAAPADEAAEDSEDDANTVTTEGAPHFLCKRPDCTRSPHAYITRAGYNGHMNKLDKIFHCNECDTSYTDKKALLLHVDSAHRGAKPFVCETCGTGLTTKFGLKTHVATTHFGQRKYPCNVDDCSFSCNNTTQLVNHVNAMHLNEKPHSCTHDGCNYRAAQKSNLNAHIRHVHEKVPYSRAEYPFACSQCTLRFTHASRLANHIGKDHTFTHDLPSCSFITTGGKACSAIFATLEELAQHMRNVHGMA